GWRGRCPSPEETRISAMPGRMQVVHGQLMVVPALARITWGWSGGMVTGNVTLTLQLGGEYSRLVILPVLTGRRSRAHAAIFSFCAGVTLQQMPCLDGRDADGAAVRCTPNLVAQK
ncbi:hypothetical protein ACDP63_24625, partial [Paracoccus sp. P2]|uniref:hypothetical protein n=1 Tax=Paracoccus sp. P2 TaxID=3248840 RepID=UPI00391F6815